MSARGIERPTRAICNICGELTNKPTRMCRNCTASYDANACIDGSVIEAMGWAARRARWYAERRKRRSRAHDGVPVMLSLAELEHLRDFAHNVDDVDHDAWWAQLDRKLTKALRTAKGSR